MDQEISKILGLRLELDLSFGARHLVVIVLGIEFQWLSSQL